ncbi:MAG: leucine-rich repeat domain-containing protein [Kiritimatiellae bacterium]|nr:leucine-rich repeat domain-containing protein [Kiritimatiellia bacterium]
MAEKDSNGVTWHYRVVDGVAEIWKDGDCAAASDSPITSLTLPTTLGNCLVKGLGAGALTGLRGLTKITIPDTYETVDASAFAGCSALREINVAAENPVYASENGILYDKRKRTLLICPAAKASAAIPDTVVAIAEGAFSGCRYLTDISFAGNAPTVPADVWVDTPEDMVVSVVAGTTGWNGTAGSSAWPSPAVWPVGGNARTLRRPGDTTKVDGEEQGTAGTTWAYTVSGGEATITAAVIPDGVTQIEIPASLGGYPVTSLTPGIFNSCDALKAFTVEEGNTAYAARNGVLYSADGTTLVKVPARFTFPSAVVTTTTTSTGTKTVLVGVDIVAGMPVDRVLASNVRESVETTVYSVDPGSTVMADLYAGVVTIADYAFTGCGYYPEGAEVVGTVKTLLNGAIVGSSSGTVVLDYAVESGSSANTNDAAYVVSITPNNQVALSTEGSWSNTKQEYEVRADVPASVTIAAHAFDASGFTAKRVSEDSIRDKKNQTTGQMALPVAGSTSSATSPFVGNASYSALLTDAAGTVVGTVAIKAAKANARTGISKVTAKVQVLGEKAKTLKGSTTAGNGTFADALAGLVLDGTSASGTLAGYGVAGAVTPVSNVAASSFAALNGRAYTVALETLDAAGVALANGYSGLSVVVARKGWAKVSGTRGGGTEVSVSAQALVGGDGFMLPGVAPLYSGKKGGFAFAMVFTGAGAFSHIAGLSDWKLVSGKSSAAIRWHVVAAAAVSASAWGGVLDANEALMPAGYSLGGAPVAGWKPRLTASTSQFKGAFTVYMPTGRKTKANVTGVVVEGVGYGSAVIKKVGSWPVTVK